MEKKPNAAQEQAITAALEGALRLISGPGSGKTFVQIRRYAHLVENGVDPRNILLVVFNRRNADEMLERVKGICPQIAGTGAEEWITTIHACCLHICQDKQDGIPGLDKYRVVESPKQWFKFEKFSIKGHIQESAEDLWPNPDARPGWSEIWDWINTSKAHGITPAESGQFFNGVMGTYHGERVYQTYMRLWSRMKALKMLTFGDMLLLVDIQLQRDSAFRARWQAKFTHVLVDEAQDVSEQAMRILATLAAPQNNFFAVGDQDQLLYRFAGAAPEYNLMGGFEERYPDGETVFMGINYRSRNSLVPDRAQMLIANNYGDLGGPYDQKYLKQLEAMPGAEPGDDFTFSAYPTPEAEAEGVADSIAALLAGEDEDGFVTGGREPGTVFVGARTRAQLGYLEGPMLRREIPFINITGGSFWESKHVADVIGYLRLAHDTNDNAAFARVYNIGSNWMTTPWKKSPHYGEYCNHRFLGAAFLRDCGESWNGLGRALNSQYGWKYRAGVDDLETFVWQVQEALEDGAAAAIQFILDNCYMKWLKTDEGLSAHDEAENGKLEDLITVQEIARQHETTEDFLAYVAECVQAAEDARNGDWDNYVVLSTVHRLKGLERDVVFGIGWGEGYVDTEDGPQPRGLLPHTFSLTEPPQNGVLPGSGMGRVEDERCLAFVLVTRAKDEVHLSYPAEYRGAKFGPSRFVYEMGLLEPEPDPDLEEELFVRAKAVAKVEAEKTLPAADVSDAEIDAAYQAEELPRPEDRQVHELVVPPPGSNSWRCRVCGQSWESYGMPYQGNIGYCPGKPREPRPDFPVPAFSDFPPDEHPVQLEMVNLDKLTEQTILLHFPPEGRFEDNIYRPAAKEMVEAMPDWTPIIDKNQLIMTKELAPDSVVWCYTSILVGEIAGGTGDDSIRVVRRDTRARDGRTFFFKNPQDWVTRRVPQDCTTVESAVAHLVGKIEGQIEDMTRNCPTCGTLQLKCKAGKGRDIRYWWKGTGDCRCKVKGGW